MKLLFNSFHLNGHTLGFHPQATKLEPSLHYLSPVKFDSTSLVMVVLLKLQGY